MVPCLIPINSTATQQNNSCTHRLRTHWKTPTHGFDKGDQGIVIREASEGATPLREQIDFTRHFLQKLLRMRPAPVMCIDRIDWNHAFFQDASYTRISRSYLLVRLNRIGPSTSCRSDSPQNTLPDHNLTTLTWSTISLGPLGCGIIVILAKLTIYCSRIIICRLPIEPGCFFRSSPPNFRT